ncbi:MAG: DegT/DnrJ/EryC1/StrS aminotransferase family protein [Treponema sp.]|nr:DegT/DnrJ/EryC1/StrS aminotransferase family protein [Treponema sp.]
MSDADSLKIAFSRPSLGEEEEKAVLSVMRSGWLTTGNVSLAFEQEFSKALSRAPSSRDNRSIISLAVNSNTSGMILAMDACGVGPGTAVITTPYTFVSTAMCARHLGADVYFADIESDSYNIDPNEVEKLLQNDTDKKIKAIIPVHIAGNVCNMQKICALADTYHVKVIEDAAHAYPSVTSMGYAGVIGDIGVFSFYVTKTLTTAEGGMVCTRDPALAKRMTTMRMHGMDRTTWDRYTSPRASWEYDIVAAGYKFNLPDILAAIGREQLKKADSFFEKRVHIVQQYNKAFASLDYLKIPPTGEGNAWHLYLLRLVPEKLTLSREQFAKELQKRGIGISVHFIPLFHFTYWQKLYPTFNSQNYPHAETQYQNTITIPLWPDMTDEMVQTVITTIKQIGEEFHA